jgi:hypothetical protein
VIGPVGISDELVLAMVGVAVEMVGVVLRDVVGEVNVVIVLDKGDD